MSVYFDECDGSPYFSFQGTKFIWNREGYTAWSDLDTFVAELMPPTSMFGATANQQYGAALPGRPSFRVVSFSAKGFGALLGQDSGGLGYYEKAKWLIQYEVPTYPSNENKETDPVGFLTHDWTGGGEFLTLPKLTLSWTSPDALQPIAKGVNAGIFIPTTEQTIAWDRVNSPPFAAIRAARGKVNDRSFNLRTGTFPPETLLFTGPHLTQQVMSNGARAWKVTYKFSEKSVTAEDVGKTLTVANEGFAGTQDAVGGWNHFWRDDSKKTGFYRLYKTNSAAAKTGSKCPYDVYNFANLYPNAS